MHNMNRRGWMGTMGTAAAGLIIAKNSEATQEEMKAAPAVTEYTLPDLPYPADALEPYIDAATLSIHHDKHHAGYVKGLNATLAKLEDARKRNDMSAIQALSRALAFNGSGHLLHTLYFACLSPKPGSAKPSLLKIADAQFGGMDALKAQLSAAASTTAGSGWAVLAWEPLGKRLLVLQLEKHENQGICGAVPILALDVWEHAYYLKYRNRRADYLNAIHNVINWKEVSRRFDAAVG